MYSCCWAYLEQTATAEDKVSAAPRSVQTIGGCVGTRVIELPGVLNSGPVWRLYNLFLQTLQQSV